MSAGYSSFPRLPYIYPRGGVPTQAHVAEPNRRPERGNQVASFFDNLIDCAGRKAHLPTPPVNRANNYLSRPYDPNKPLLDFDIYTSKPAPNIRGVENSVVEEVRAQIMQISELYKEAHPYVKPKFIPLIPVPPKRTKRRKQHRYYEEDSISTIKQSVGASSKDALPSVKDGGLQPVTAKKQTKKTKKGSEEDIVPLTSKPKKPKGPYNPNLASYGMTKNKFLRIFRRFIIFANFVIRLRHKQITKGYDLVTPVLKEFYPKAQEDTLQFFVDFMVEPLKKPWARLATDPEINIMINQQVLYSYALISSEEAGQKYSITEKQQIYQGAEPNAQNLHVSLLYSRN